MMDKINQNFSFFETLWCKQSGSASYSVKTTVWEKINGKFIPLPPEIKDGKMARFGASTLIWGERGLLFHLILSKMAGLEIFIKVFR